VIGEGFPRVKLFADCNESGKIEAIGLQFLKEGTDRVAASRYVCIKDRSEARIAATALVERYKIYETIEMIGTNRLLLLPDTDEGLDNFYVALLVKP
jgi:hypothetical protein